MPYKPMDKLVHELFRYDSSIGGLFWKVDRGSNKLTGTRAGTVNNNTSSRGAGYRRIIVNKMQYFEHRLVWLYFNGRWPIRSIDHINGIKDDNRIENLRMATRNENHVNSKRQPGPSGVRNVVLLKSGRYRAQIVLHLGTFDTKEEAAQAAYEGAKKIHGKFVNPEHYRLQQKTAMTSDGEPTWQTEMEG